MSVTSDRTGRIEPEKPAGSNLHVSAAAYAENEKKTKKQLIDELVDLRQRLLSGNHGRRPQTSRSGAMISHSISKCYAAPPYQASVLL